MTDDERLMGAITATCPKCQEQVMKLGPAYITIDRVRYIICDKCAVHEDKMTVSVIIKRGNETLVDIKGKPVDPKLITMADMHMVYEVEAFMEKMTGYRWHISIAEGADAKPVQD
jgi:hypothetical protein